MKYQTKNMETESDIIQLGLRFLRCTLDVHELTEPRPLVKLVTGVDNCAETLEMKTDEVLFCILPATSQKNISVRIQQKLIAAFCTENEIEFREIDDVREITAALSQFPANINNNTSLIDIDDLGCILVCEMDKQDPQGG